MMNSVFKAAGAVAALLLAPVAEATLVTFEAAGATPAAITATRDAYDRKSGQFVMPFPGKDQRLQC